MVSFNRKVQITVEGYFLKLNYKPSVSKHSYVNGDASQAHANELMSKLYKKH